MSTSESIVCPNCNERSPAGYILCPYCGFDLIKIIRSREKVRVTIKETLGRIWRSLYDPRKSKTLFHEIGVNPDRKGAILVLYLLSVTFSIRLGSLLLKTNNPNYFELALWYTLTAPWILGFAMFLLALFGWFIIGLIIWILAKTLGGKAGLRDTLGILGYSFGPLITASFVINIIIVFIGPVISSIATTTWRSFNLFEIFYIPFIALCAYHCGNGIHSAHLLNNTYSYGICAFISIAYTLFYLLPVFIS